MNYSKKLIRNSLILASPGLISMFISLVSIPIHLKIAGLENYGNYILFHFLFTLGNLLNLGIGKSIVVCSNSNNNFKKYIGYEGIIYTFFISFIFLLLFLILFFIKLKFLYLVEAPIVLILGIISTIIFISLESTLQANERFTLLSIANFLFYSLSISVPSICLLFFNKLDVKSLILLSLFIKIFAIAYVGIFILKKKLIKKSSKIILLQNLKKNSKWLTLNCIFVQIYDVLDKYLVKIFIGPIALATYSIPQQLTGKLSVISKGFSSFLLPFLSRKKYKDDDFNQTLDIFIILIPFIIFLLFPFFHPILKVWLGEEFEYKMVILTKIFTLSIIFGCISHILVTKFEANQKMRINFIFELLLLPFFIGSILYLSFNKYSLVYFSVTILLKELILLTLRLFFYRNEIKKIIQYSFYISFFILLLGLSFYNNLAFYILVIILIIVYIIKK